MVFEGSNEADSIAIKEEPPGHLEPEYLGRVIVKTEYEDYDRLNVDQNMYFNYNNFGDSNA